MGSQMTRTTTEGTAAEIADLLRSLTNDLSNSLMKSEENNRNVKLDVDPHRLQTPVLRQPPKPTRTCVAAETSLPEVKVLQRSLIPVFRQPLKPTRTTTATATTILTMANVAHPRKQTRVSPQLPKLTETGTTIARTTMTAPIVAHHP